MSLTLRVQPSSTLKSSALSIPGDKSISHRAIMLAAIADGETEIHHFLNGEDCLHTMKLFQAMGVPITASTDCTTIHVQGVGKHGLTPPEARLTYSQQFCNKLENSSAKSILNCGNSGTTMRLMMGLLSGQSFATILTGDESLQKRPMARVSTPLITMGAAIELTQPQFAPVYIKPSQGLKAINYQLPVASAQVKSALLLAALYAPPSQTLILHELETTRDHTERMLQQMGGQLEKKNHTLYFPCGQSLHSPGQINIPGDISSAAFFIVAALIAKQSHITLHNVGINPTRADVLKILSAMGASIEIKNFQQYAEPIATLTITPSSLKGIVFPREYIAVAIDEMPILMIAAAMASGTTEIRNAAELRVKESDRIKTMVEGLTTLGIKVEEYPDGVKIEGGTFKGGRIQSYGDHRIAMAFAIAAIGAKEEIIIENCDNIHTSFPQFVDLCQQIGIKIEID
jgi:3-phosphoshikimate 1-carboxyvinyltransferase